MLIIPAIDIMDGKVVRLFRGEKDKKTIYSNNPLEIALKWQEQGAEWIHLVDLDGAINGVYSNIGLLEDVIKNLKIKVEVSGGIRTREILDKAMEMGASRVVLGTKAVEDSNFVKQAVISYKEKIAVAIDMQKGKVSSRGWLAQTNITAIDLAKNMQNLGVKCLICTDISRDGTLQGPNIEMINQVSKAVSLDLIASGGVSNLEDIKALRDLRNEKLKGVIVGKALYENKFTLTEAQKAANVS